MNRIKCTFLSTCLLFSIIGGMAILSGKIYSKNSNDAGFSAPSRPILLTNVDHGKVILYWEASAEASVDSLTNYADFEGYKVYKSTDGGLTWGGPDDRIYDYDGNFIGWNPIAQFDLTEEDDINHCIYVDSVCSSGENRGIEISGYDPYQPRIYLGKNTGLRYMYVDSNVVDGVEYTYSMTAYDMGLRTYNIDYIINEDSTGYVPDTVWSPSNPDHWTSLDGGGFRSLECDKGDSLVDPNFVTVIPGYYASNITFPARDDVDQFLVKQQGTIGNGEKVYSIVDESELTDVLLKFEIEAQLAENALQGMKTLNPKLFIYEIDNLESQVPVNVINIPTIGIHQDTLAYLMGLPGADSTQGMLYLPNYLLQYTLNVWSDFFNGIRVRFTNMPDKMYDLDSDFEVLHDVEWYADSTVIKSVSFYLWYVNSTIFEQCPNFDYKIEFTASPGVDTVAGTAPPSGCIGLPSKTLLPFRIINMTTGKQIVLKHVDKGVNGTGSSSNDDPGYKDCIWTRNEELQFFRDSLLVGTDTLYSTEKTYNLKLNINLQEAFPGITEEEWNSSTTYSEGDYVWYAGMVWKASRDINEFVEPVSYIDTTGDDINDNPWEIQYPWKDGDYVIIKPKKSFVDGDSWIADLSMLGKSHKVTQDELEDINVVPNPYIVHSRFETSQTLSHRLRFTHLPQKCRITIYTINGEKVISLEHDNEYDGNEWWDLRTINNQEVAPGLYIYLVEAEGLTHIGKFAVVR